MGEFVRAKALQKVGCMAVYNQDWCAVWVNSIKSEEMCLKVHREIGIFSKHVIGQFYFKSSQILDLLRGKLFDLISICELMQSGRWFQCCQVTRLQ